MNSINFSYPQNCFIVPHNSLHQFIGRIFLCRTIPECTKMTFYRTMSMLRKVYGSLSIKNLKNRKLSEEEIALLSRIYSSGGYIFWIQKNWLMDTFPEGISQNLLFKYSFQLWILARIVKINKRRWEKAWYNNNSIIMQE